MIPLYAVVAGAIIAVCGGVIAGIFTLWVAFINARKEERKNLHTLLFNAAIENWKADRALWEKCGGAIEPLDTYLLHMFKLKSILEDSRMKVDTIEPRLKSVNDFTHAVRNQNTTREEKITLPKNS